MQNLTTGGLADMVGESGGELWLDGGHNPHAARAVANAVAASNLIDAVQRAINTGEALSRQTVDEPITPPRILICGSLYLAGEVLKL